jgi:N-methylhydantoinase A
MSAESPAVGASRLRVGIDVGGTFTDAAIWNGQAGGLVFAKVPSTPPVFGDGVINAGLEALLAIGATFADVSHLVHSTTAAANVVAEKKGARVGLITTAGFRDVLEIQRTRRDQLYDLQYSKPVPLVPRELRLGVPERVDSSGTVLVALDEDATRAAIRELRDAGCEAIAVVFLFSFLNPKHELRVAELIEEEYPEAFVSISSTVNPEFREYERASTTVVDAYVKPEVTTYYKNLERRLRDEYGFTGRLDIIQSGGGAMACEDAAKRPSQTVESGPACGAIAAAHLARVSNLPRVIAFDMGGTTAKATYIEGGALNTNNTLYIDRLPVRAPVVDLKEISGGGGTLAWCDDSGLLRVGPRSAGAVPGPACYARGGQTPTLTDVNALLGYYPDELIGGAMKLDIAAAGNAVREHLAERLGMGEIEAALGALRIANFDMESAIRLVTTQRGIDVRTCALIAFGGAGPVHAASLARELGIRQVIIPPAPGNVNAFGALIADSRYDFHGNFTHTLDEAGEEELRDALAALEQVAGDAVGDLSAADREEFAFERQIDARYVGQGFELTIPLPTPEEDPDWRRTLRQRFIEKHEALYRTHDPDGKIELLTVRVTAVRSADLIDLKGSAGGSAQRSPDGRRSHTRSVRFEGSDDVHEADVYSRAELVVGERFSGPAIVEEHGSTTVVPPGCDVEVDTFENLVLTLELAS